MAEPDVPSNRHWIAFLSGIILFFTVLVLPSPADLQVPAQRMLAVAMLMAVWWLGEAVPIAVTALLPIALYPLLGIMPSKAVAPNYGNHLIFLFLGGFMIALAMEKWNLHKRVALNIIAKTGTSLPRLVLGFMLASAFLSMWISNTATTMMMLPVAMAVVRQVAVHASIDGRAGGETEKALIGNFGLVLMLALAYSASIGGIGTLIGTPPNIVFAGFFKSHYPDAEEISFMQWMIVAVPVVLIFLPVVWWYLCRFVPRVSLDRFKTGDDALRVIDREREGLGPMQGPERVVAIVFVLTALLWVFRKPLVLGGVTVPGWSELFSNPAGIHDATVAMAMGLLLMAFPLKLLKNVETEDRREWCLLDWETVRTRMPWGILLLFGGGFALASGFKASGLDVWLGAKLSLVTQLPLWMLVALLCLGLTFLTEMTSNTATATMILPIIAATADASGIEPLQLLVPATLSASFAFMMPVATPPNAIVFGSGWVTMPQMARAGLVLNLLGATLITFFALTVIQWVLVG